MPLGGAEGRGQRAEGTSSSLVLSFCSTSSAWCFEASSDAWASSLAFHFSSSESRSLSAMWSESLCIDTNEEITKLTSGLTAPSFSLSLSDLILLFMSLPPRGMMSPEPPSPDECFSCSPLLRRIEG